MSLKQGHLSTLYDLMFFIPTVSLFSGVFINIIFTFIANLTKCFALIIKKKTKNKSLKPFEISFPASRHSISKPDIAALLEQGEEPWIIVGDVRRCKKLDPRKAKAGGSHQPREQPHRLHRRRKGTAGMVFGSSLRRTNACGVKA